MFFSISRQQKDNFTDTQNLGDLWLHLDAGWHHASDANREIWYKGYVDDFDIHDNLRFLVQDRLPRFTGNFAIIEFDRASRKISISSDLYRSFPIFVHDDEVTNLIPSSRVIWCDNTIDIDQDLRLTEQNINVVGDINIDPVDLSVVIDNIHDILTRKTQKFLSHNRLPIRCFLSGGIDSLLVYSYLSANTKNYSIVRSSHVDYDRFWLKNHGTLTHNFWGYSQIHHWNQPTVLTSGTPGDEFMLRSPCTVDLWLKAHDHKMLDLLTSDRWNNCLHLNYFKRPNYLDIFANQQLDPRMPKKYLARKLCNMVLNDWQHWHLGETLTWTPLRDLDIFKWLLRLPLDHALTQIMDSSISKQLIARNDPTLLSVISTQKNHHNYMSNLEDFYEKIDASSGQ